MNKSRVQIVGVKDSISKQLHISLTKLERDLMEAVEAARPRALRTYDQIAMRSEDLLRQAKLMTPYLKGRRVAFIGDYDGTSMVVGILGMLGHPLPARMDVFDFDLRVLEAIQKVAIEYGFDSLLNLWEYNVKEPIPEKAPRDFEWFYTNPPYGSGNDGESARVFIARGFELTDEADGHGCVILPSDASRPWAEHAMHTTQAFLLENDWSVSEMLANMHRYHLDDDKELPSSLLIIHRLSSTTTAAMPNPYAGRLIEDDEIPYFYGRSASAPHPHRIGLSEEPIYRTA